MGNRELWKVYDGSGAWVAVCRSENVARHVLIGLRLGSVVKVTVEEERTWEAVARSFLS